MIFMKSQLHHVALNVQDIKWYTAFFEEIFGMKVRKTSGSTSTQKVWFFEGIQLNECPNKPAMGEMYDHISLAVPNIAETVEAALKAGCTPLPNGEHWFALPNGVRVELMCTEVPAL